MFRRSGGVRHPTQETSRLLSFVGRAEISAELFPSALTVVMASISIHLAEGSSRALTGESCTRMEPHVALSFGALASAGSSN